jgi:deoxyribodipyrimidine photolyase-like uncharacterized protein
MKRNIQFFHSVQYTSVMSENARFIILPNALYKLPPIAKGLEAVIVLDAFYINENCHKQKLALLLAASDDYANRYNCKTVSEIHPRVGDVMFMPLDKPMRYKYRKCTFVNCPGIISYGMDFDLRSLSYFYKNFRTHFDILMENGKPAGNRWSYDTENRNRFPRDYEENNIHVKSDKFVKLVNKKYPNAYGSLTKLLYPINHSSAKRYFKSFIKNKLNDFGKYQDAFRSNVAVGNHANISAVLNIGLIDPKWMIDEVLKSDACIESKEAFIRQMAWREYMFHIYDKSPKYTRFFKRQVPKSWYDASTGVYMIDTIINKVLETGYAHHIERLMVINAAMTMLEMDSYNWFMRLFVDSYEWVMHSCVRMNYSSLMKDKFMKRMYISSNAYIKKMSNYNEPVFDDMFREFVKNHASELSRDYVYATHAKRITNKKMNLHNRI